MNLLKMTFLLLITVFTASTSADNRSGDAAVGGGLGGALGGYIGSETGGQAGAIIGSAAGAAIGSAISTNTDTRFLNGATRYNDRRDYSYRDDRHDDYRPRYKHHKKCPPGLAMQNRC